MELSCKRIVPLDLALFAEKVRHLREMFQEDVSRLAQATQIPEDRLRELEAASTEPTGDEILILADHFREDFRFFISNEQRTIFERTDKLFRAHGAELSAADRWAIQEFLVLCDNESFLMQELDRRPTVSFSHTPSGTYFKGHGYDAARELRKTLRYGPLHVPDVFGDLRSLGYHVFRRRLENARLSGLFIDHPTAGACLLVNYSEDTYRQRFTAVHEAAHAIFDRGDEFVVSFSKWSKEERREFRAEAFASGFLVPPELLSGIDAGSLNEERLLNLAGQLKVSVRALLRAFERDKILTRQDVDRLDTLRLPRDAKTDPELAPNLTDRQRTRKLELLQRGLSSAYVELCLDALREGVVSRARVCEMLLLEQNEFGELLDLFGRVPS